MRFVHLADAHLDMTFPGRSRAVRDRLREGSREAFRAAVDLALREEVHALLIAGDLFDGDRLSFQTERFLLDEARRLSAHGVTVVYATGNHDPGRADAGPRRLRWPPNVHVAADATAQRIAVHDRDGDPVGFVTAVGHEGPRIRDDLSRGFPPPVGGLPEVALLHTQVHSASGSQAHHAYAPSDLSRLQRAGYDYWALGHVHVRQVLSRDPPVVYSGSLQGRTHTDTGDRGVYLVDLGHRGAPAIEFRPLAPIRWETLRVDGLERADSVDRLEHRVVHAWRSAREEAPGAPGTEWMVRVRLRGPCPLWRELRADEDLAMVGQELADRLGALEVRVEADRVHPVVPVEESRTRVDPLGEALRLAQRVRAGEAVLDGLAPEDLVGAGGQDAETLARYVRRLLEDVDGELVARFRSDGGDAP